MLKAMKNKRNLTNFTRAIRKSKKFGGSFSRYDGSHQGVLLHENHAICPDTGRRKWFYYYLTDPGTPIQKPKVNKIFAHEVYSVSTRHARRKQDVGVEEEQEEEEPEPEEEPAPEEPEPKRLKFSEQLQRETAWDSTKDKSCCNPSDNENVMECLQRRIGTIKKWN